MNQVLAIRKRLGVTQTALAHAIGMTQGNVSFYEHGRRVPSDVAERLIAYAALQGLAITYDHVYGLKALPRSRKR